MTRAGDSGRSRRVIRLIAAERFVRGIVLLGAGVYLLGHLGADYGRLAERLMRAIELDPHRRPWNGVVTHLHALHAEQLRVLGVLALLYGVLETVEGVGLWLDQLWAEVLTVIATSLLIPLELYELIHRPSIWKAGGIAANVAIVAYLGHLLRRRMAHRHRAEGRIATGAPLRESRPD